MTYETAKQQIRPGVVFEWSDSPMGFSEIRDLDMVKGTFHLSDFAPSIIEAKATKKLANGGHLYTLKNIPLWGTLKSVHFTEPTVAELPIETDYVML